MTKKILTPEQEKPKVNPKLETKPTIIDEDLDLKNDLLQENNFTRSELLNQIAYYAGELVVELNGIYIGGVAAQKRDQLFEVLIKLKNLN